MKSLKLSVLLVLALPLVSQGQDHGHLNVGALGTAQNDQLFFENGADFVDSSGYIKTLNYTNGGRFANYYEGNITLTALPATPAHAGPDPSAPAPGSFIQFSFSCLSGPPGGEFAFWDAGTTAPSLSLSTGQTSTNLWRLTEADGSPGSDPYGHIHGRRFTATKTGLYQISFRAVDTSTNGAGGGPIHMPSDDFAIWFQAGVTLQMPPEFPSSISFAAPAGTQWQLETTTQFDPLASWDLVGPVRTATDYLLVYSDLTTAGGIRFYRIRQVGP